MKHESKSVTRVEHRVVVTQEDLLKWVIYKEAGVRKLPPDAEATITVPSGGDYSGDNLDIDEVGGVTVTWTETTEERLS